MILRRKDVIIKTTAEINSNYDRVRWAEGLILQLPENHDGRNSWLLNYGTRDEAKLLRLMGGLSFDELTQSAERIIPEDK